MSAEQFPDVSLEFMDGGLVRIEQSTGNGETTLTDLHRVHVAFIAERMGLLKGGPDLSQQVATLTRRIEWLSDRIDEIPQRLPSDMHERCGDAYAFDLWFDMFGSAKAELLADLRPFREQGAHEQQFSEAVKEADGTYAIRARTREASNLPIGTGGEQLSMPLASCNAVALENN